MAVSISIEVNESNPAALGALKVALQKIANNFNKNNVQYIAELSEKENVNEKFDKLKNNTLVKKLL